MDRRNGRDSSALALAAGGIGLCLAARALVRSRRWIDLKGRVVFITGGSRGLGLVMARKFVDHGARVAICARDQDELDRAVADLSRRGGDVASIACDVTDHDQVERTIREVEQHGVFPGLSTELFSLIGHALPGPGGIGEQRLQGKDSESAVTPLFLTDLTRRTAVENNQVG